MWKIGPRLVDFICGIIQGMEHKIFKKRDLLIIALLLAAALLALFLIPRHKGSTAVVSYDGEIVMEIDLGKDGIYHIEGQLPVTLEVADDHIRFIHSVCPDHLCEGFGLIGDDGEWAVCAPARVSVQVVGN